MKEPKDEMELEMKGNEVEKHNVNITESAINDEDMMSVKRNDEVTNTVLPISSEMGCELLEQLQRENEDVNDKEKGEEKKEEKAVENIEKEDEEKEEEEDRQQFSQRCGNSGTQITSFDNEELLPKPDECTYVTMPPEEYLADEDIIIVEPRPADSLSTPLEIILDSHNKPEGDVLYTKRMETSEELRSNEIMECKENDTTQNEGDCDEHGSCAIIGAKDPSVDRREVNTKEEEEENKEPKMKQKHTSVSFYEEGDEVFDRVCDDHPSLLRSSSGTDLEAMYQNADAIDSEHLFEMLCRCQSRRLNDQRCSFRRKKLAEGTRPWKSAPASPATERKVFFASVTSLQAERFFDMLACSQSRRLNDQRADFQEVSVNQCQEELQSKPEPESEPKVKVTATAPAGAAAATIKEPNQVPDDDLYNTIITHQAGRIDDQRSDPPLPAAAEDFFDLILRVQGGRMEEQRVALPPSLKNTAQRVNAI